MCALFLVGYILNLQRLKKKSEKVVPDFIMILKNPEIGLSVLKLA